MPKCTVPKWLAQEDQPLPHPYGLIAGGRWQQIRSFSQNSSQSGEVWQNWTMCISQCAGWWSSWGHAAKFLSGWIWSSITKYLPGPRTRRKNLVGICTLHFNHNIHFHVNITVVSVSDTRHLSGLNLQNIESWNLSGSPIQWFQGKLLVA